MEACLEGFPRQVTSLMNAKLLKEPTAEEFGTTLAQMAPLKAPGPDGFPACFYLDNWATVGTEVCKASFAFFNSCILDASVNFTHIALVPKKPNATKVTDFRPISLCNVGYKIISKVLANRLKLILPHIISHNQSAFIPGRLISDNVLAAYETLHSMHTRMYGKVGYMALKLDMSKAYDRVEWVFLAEVMRRMRFAEKWIQLIMECVSSVTYAVLINGNPVGNIRPTRGLRQGDPLSPYLFILCAEVLSYQLQQAERNGLLGGVPTFPRGPRLNHLFFADDSLLFCKTTVQDWQQLLAILDLYERASGQKLNKDKTTVFFSRNTSSATRAQILNLTGVPTSQRYDKYLGLPALVGKSRVREFQYITDKVRQRVSDWKVKFLSQAGKEILIKAVLQAIPTYCMSLFLLPKKLCNDLNGLMQNFWWGQNNGSNKIHWLKWEKLGCSKNQGGLGFRDVHCFNRALLAKQGWRLLQDPNSLAGKIIKAKYFPHCTFLEAQKGTRGSYAWSSIFSARALLIEGLIWRIGDGKQVKIWGDKWVPQPSTFKIQSPCKSLPMDAVVAELIDPVGRGWNIPLVKSIFNQEEAGLICNIPLSRYNQPDKLIWRAANSGMFTVRSAYFIEHEKKSIITGEGSHSAAEDSTWKEIWRLPVPNSVKMFMWRACRDILPTKENLFKRRTLEEAMCIFCQQEVETTRHVLWDCPAAMDVWGGCVRKFQKIHVQGTDFRDVWEALIQRCNGEELAFSAILARNIWHRRNVVVHGGSFSHPAVLIQEANSACQLQQQVSNREEESVEMGEGKWAGTLATSSEKHV
jgi:hypothetical protein